MSDETAVEQLSRHGDPLEKVIVESSDDLNLVIQPYAEIWKDHVVPRRINKGAQVKQDWMNFAGSHYTALIRVYHAYQVYGLIMERVKEGPKEGALGKFLLTVHYECASFWEQIGSAIDNLATTFEDAKLIQSNKSGRDYLTEKYEDLAYAYDRRSQFIHSRIIPTGVTESITYLRSRKTETKQRHLEPKNVKWDLEYDAEKILDEVLPQEWERFLKEVASAWWHLRNQLHEKDTSRPIVDTPKIPEIDMAKPFTIQPYDTGGYVPPSNIVPLVETPISFEVPPILLPDGPPPSGT